MIRTANPALNESVFSRARTFSSRGETMTVNGTVKRTAVLLILCVATAVWSWNDVMLSQSSWAERSFNPSVWLWVGGLGGFLVAIVTIFKKEFAPFTAPLYAALEGLFLGAISAGFETRFPGIVMQAILGTFGTLFALLFAYRSGLIRATENFKLGVFAATGGIGLIYLMTIIAGLFGVQIPYIHESGTAGILFSVFVVVVAALNLVLDFDFIEHGAAGGAPKYMEWYAAFGLMVTLVWLYLEILRLLSKSRRQS